MVPTFDPGTHQATPAVARHRVAGTRRTGVESVPVRTAHYVGLCSGVELPAIPAATVTAQTRTALASCNQ